MNSVARPVAPCPLARPMAGTHAEPSLSPRGLSVANGSPGHPGELQLPDGDDLLGMTAHTPAGVAQVSRCSEQMSEHSGCQDQMGIPSHANLKFKQWSIFNMLLCRPKVQLEGCQPLWHKALLALCQRPKPQRAITLLHHLSGKSPSRLSTVLSSLHTGSPLTLPPVTQAECVNRRGPPLHNISSASSVPGRGRSAPQAWRTPAPIGRGRTPLDQGRGRGGRRPLQMLPVQVCRYLPPCNRSPLCCLVLR